MTIINMQTMRYINLLDRVSHVKTSKCFVYNNKIFFAVPRMMIPRAIGPDLSNLRMIQMQIGKKIKIIAEAAEPRDVKRFVEDIVSPVKFKALEISDNMMIITAGSVLNKAALIGREKRRMLELAQVVKDNFGLDLKIV